MLSHDDLNTLLQKGITEAQLYEQLHRFATGFPFLTLSGAATPAGGITILTPDEEAGALERWQQFLSDGGDVQKMVPASGAASRMFKALFAFVEGDTATPAEGSDVAEVIANIEQFAFLDDLNRVLIDQTGMDALQLRNAGRYKEIISGIIMPSGLDYGNLPKGLLKFHKYNGAERRTPLEEQLMEGAQTVADRDGNVRVHFTVSTSHRQKFEQKISETLPQLQSQTGKHFTVTLSEQKPSTDTIAANEDNTPFREDGKMVFRPGGHGALIQNLNDLDATVVFIKNIDNVVPDSQRTSTLHYKQVLGGYLMELHDAVASYIAKLKEEPTEKTYTEVKDFLLKKFSIEIPAEFTGESLRSVLLGKLNRPLRVCGMVKNEGEPGGGPFVVKEADGTTSLQILESTQIDKNNRQSMEMLAHATHFNPVDLVCYIKDVDGNKFNLPDYVDPDTGFISSKSLHGKPLKALELPGLWNGAMSNWLTAFVEVPVSTFNPVKTVNDLLRPAHRQ